MWVWTVSPLWGPYAAQCSEYYTFDDEWRVFVWSIQTTDHQCFKGIFTKPADFGQGSYKTLVDNRNTVSSKTRNREKQTNKQWTTERYFVTYINFCAFGKALALNAFINTRLFNKVSATETNKPLNVNISNSMPIQIKYAYIAMVRFAIWTERQTNRQSNRQTEGRTIRYCQH